MSRSSKARRNFPMAARGATAGKRMMTIRSLFMAGRMTALARLAMAIVIAAIISLTLTPMMSARLTC